MKGVSMKRVWDGYWQWFLIKRVTFHKIKKAQSTYFDMIDWRGWKHCIQTFLGGYTWYTFHNKENKNDRYMYFAQLRHNLEDANLMWLVCLNYAKNMYRQFLLCLIINRIPSVSTRKKFNRIFRSFWRAQNNTPCILSIGTSVFFWTIHYHINIG